MAEPFVIVAARQSNDLSLYPGQTPPNAEAIRQLYEDQGCGATVQFVDHQQVAASVEAGLVWWGFFLGLASTLLIVALVAHLGRWRKGS